MTDTDDDVLGLLGQLFFFFFFFSLGCCPWPGPSRLHSIPSGPLLHCFASLILVSVPSTRLAALHVTLIPYCWHPRIPVAILAFCFLFFPSPLVLAHVRHWRKDADTRHIRFYLLLSFFFASSWFVSRSGSSVGSGAERPFIRVLSCRNPPRQRGTRSQHVQRRPELGAHWLPPPPLPHPPQHAHIRHAAVLPPIHDLGSLHLLPRVLAPRPKTKRGIFRLNRVYGPTNSES
jgi:hypothetical protein